MRARNIKPGFFHNEDVVELPPETRLLFIGLWLMADKAGRLEDRPKRIKMQLFPADDWNTEHQLSVLHEAGLIVRYEKLGCKYIEIPKFLEHQRPHHQEKESVIPPRCEEVRTKVRTDSNESTSQSALIPDTGYLNPDSPIPDTSPPAKAAAVVAELREIFPKRAGSQPWRNAERAINARLTEGHTAAEIVDGARRYAEFIRATGKEGTEFVQQAATFCGPSKRFLEPWDAPKSKSERLQDKNVEAAQEFLNGS